MSKKRGRKIPVQLVLFEMPVEKLEPVGPQLQTFDFDTHAVRVYLIDGEYWFVAVDVCRALGLDNVSLAINGQTRLDAKGKPYQSGGLDDDEKGVHTVNTLGGKQELSTINESGLYSLILASRKPEAKRFKRWVTHEVLPSIRKTGSFGQHTGRLAREIRRLGNCDPATAKLRLDQFDLNKTVHAQFARDGATPYHFKSLHNGIYEAVFGGDAPELRKLLGLGRRQTPLDRMAFIPLHIKGAALAILDRIVQDSLVPISLERQIEMAVQFAEQILAEHLSKFGTGYTVGIRDDRDRGKVLDIVGNARLN